MGGGDKKLLTICYPPRIPVSSCRLHGARGFFWNGARFCRGQVFCRAMGPGFLQGNGARFFAGQWGQVFCRAMGPGFLQGNGGSFFAGQWGQVFLQGNGARFFFGWGWVVRQTVPATIIRAKRPFNKADNVSPAPGPGRLIGLIPQVVVNKMSRGEK